MAEAKRKSKHITNPKDVEYLVNITCDEARRRSTIMKLFADFGDGPKYHVYDTIDIPPGKYGQTKKNKNTFTTTLGLWIYNKGSIEPMADVLGYVNQPVNNGVYGKINQKISYSVLEEKIPLDDLKDFIMQGQIYMGCTTALAPSHTMKMVLITNDIEKKKAELIKTKYGDAIKNKDIKAVNALENELIDYAKDSLKGDPSRDMYDSGARSNWGNNFKNMYVMKGVVRLSDGSYDVVTSSYISGLKKDEFVKTNDSAVGGPYSRAVNTKNGGALEKQFVSAMQHLRVGPPGSDCGTTRTIPVLLTNDNIKWFMYSFVKQGNKLVEITSDNMDSFIGKKVNIRFFAMCESKDAICEKCAGTMFNRLGGISNIGVASYQLASTLKNLAMKSFHDSTLKLAEIDVGKAFGYDE